MIHERPILGHDESSHLTKVEEVRDRNIENAGKLTGVSFSICRRLNRTDPLRLIPERDAIDVCAGHCGAEVVYDRKHSEGKLHYCVNCVRRMGDRRFQPLNDDKVENLNDVEQYQKLLLSVAQSKVNEHRVNFTPAPRHRGVER